MTTKSVTRVCSLFVTCFLFVNVFCGTVYKTVYREGNGVIPKPGQTVTVHYRGYLKNGPQFDSSYDRNETFQFKLGNNEVIKGWEAGISSMKVGEMSKLEIAPEDAYGEQGNGPIPKNAELVFYIELLKVDGIPSPKAIHMQTQGSNVQPKGETFPASTTFDSPGQNLPPETFPGQGQGQGQTFTSGTSQGTIFTPPEPPTSTNQIEQFRGSLIRQDQVMIPQQPPAGQGQGQISGNSIQSQRIPGFPQDQNNLNTPVQGQQLNVNFQQPFDTNTLQGQTFGQTFPGGQGQASNPAFDSAITLNQPQAAIPGQGFNTRGQSFNAGPSQTVGFQGPSQTVGFQGPSQTGQDLSRMAQPRSQNFLSSPRLPQNVGVPGFQPQGVATSLPQAPGRSDRFSPASSPQFTSRQAALPQAPPPGPPMTSSGRFLPPASRGNSLPMPGQDTQFGRVSMSDLRSQRTQRTFGSPTTSQRIPGGQDFPGGRISDQRFDPSMNELRTPPMMDGVDPRISPGDPAFSDPFSGRGFRSTPDRTVPDFMRSRGGGFPPDFPPRDIPSFRGGPRRFPDIDPRAFRGFPMRFGRDMDPMMMMMERSRRARMRRRF